MEQMRAQILEERSSFPAELNLQAWLRHTALPVFIPSTRLWLRTSFHRPIPVFRHSPPALSLYFLLFSLSQTFGSFFASYSPSLWLLFTASFPSLPIFDSLTTLLPSLSFYTFSTGGPPIPTPSRLPVVQSVGGWGQALEVSIVILCVLMSLVLIVCS